MPPCGWGLALEEFLLLSILWTVCPSGSSAWTLDSFTCPLVSARGTGGLVVGSSTPAPAMDTKIQEVSVAYIKWCSICIETVRILLYTLNQRSPNLFSTRNWFRGRQFFQWTGVGWGEGVVSRWFKYITFLHLYYYYISCIRASDIISRGWGPLL